MKSPKTFLCVETVQKKSVENENLLKKIMKFKCNTKNFAEACIAVSRAVPGKSTNAALESLYIRSTDAGIMITGYDGDFAVTGCTDAEIAEEGAFLVKASIFCEMLKGLPGEYVDISVNERFVIHTVSGVSNFDLNGSDASVYPELPFVAASSPVILEQKVFRDLVRSTVFAVSQEDARVAMRGVKFDFTANKLSAVALDGYRVAIRNVATDYQGSDMSYIIPGKSLTEIVKFLGDDGTISLNPSDKVISFGIDGYTIISRLLEGDFIDYKRVLPGSFTTELGINSREFISKLSGISFLSSADRQKTPVKCVISDGEMTLHIVSDNGVADTKISVEQSGDDIEIGFNVSYIMDAVRAADTDKIMFKMNKPHSPAAILPVEGDGFYYLVLPIRFR